MLPRLSRNTHCVLRPPCCQVEVGWREADHCCVVPEQCSQGPGTFRTFLDVPNVPNDVPNIPGHGGQYGLLAEGYVAKISMLIWLHILLLRWMSPFETKIKTDIPKFQHVDFWCFGLILTDFELILVNVGQTDLGYISCCCVGWHRSKPKSKLTSPDFNMLTFGVLV